MKPLDAGSRVVLASLFSLIGWKFYGSIGFWCMFAVLNSVFKGE